MIGTLVLTTPTGDFSALVHDDVVVGGGFRGIDELVSRLETGLREQRAASAPLPWLADALGKYFGGTVDALDHLPVRQPGTPLRQRMWEALRGVTAGEPVAYGELAARAGSPRAARAAGTACAINKVALIVPCHRVVRSGGDVGNYGYGVPVKRWLLEHERASAAASA